MICFDSLTVKTTYTHAAFARCCMQVAKATMLIGDPSYFPTRMVKPTGMVARSICIMDHPINGTNNAESTQIIIPGRQVGASI